MKLSKKVTSVALASVLAMSMVVSGFAADGNSKQGGDKPTPTPTTVVTPTPTPTPKPTTVVTPTPTPTPAPTPAPVVYEKVSTVKASATKASIDAEAPAFTKATLKKAKKLKALTLKKATGVSFAKNATKKAKKLKKITAKKVVSASNVKFAKGSLTGLPKNCKMIFSRNMPKADQEAVKKAAKAAGFKGTILFK